MSDSECRNFGCTNPRDPDSDGFRRYFCSVECEVKFDHIREDACVDKEIEEVEEIRDRIGGGGL